MTHLRFDKLTNLPFVLPGDTVDKKDKKAVLDTAEAIQGFGKVDPDDKRLDRKPKHDLQGALDAHLAFSGPSDGWSYKRINDWQDEVFGLHGVDPLARNGVMDKIDEEVKELREALVNFQSDKSQENWDKLERETADLAIMVAHLAGVSGVDLTDAVNSKMDINAEREWDVNESGSGRHKD